MNESHVYVELFFSFSNLGILGLASNSPFFCFKKNILLFFIYFKLIFNLFF
jgi:hypothetical protein